MAESSLLSSSNSLNNTLCLTLKQTKSAIKNQNLDYKKFILSNLMDLKCTKSEDTSCANSLLTNGTHGGAFRFLPNDVCIDYSQGKSLNCEENECLKCKDKIERLNLIIEIQRQEKEDITKFMSASVSQDPISINLKSCEVQTNDSLIAETYSVNSNHLDISTPNSSSMGVVIVEDKCDENGYISSPIGISAATKSECHGKDTEIKQEIESAKKDTFNSSSLEIDYMPPSYTLETQTQAVNLDSLRTDNGNEDSDDIALDSFVMIDYPSSTEDIIIREQQQEITPCKKKLFTSLKSKLTDFKAKITKKCQKNISVICYRCPKCNNIFEKDLLNEENELCRYCARQITFSASDNEIMNK